jgi:xanthine dehydrogenase molybdopterin-binding subunit B
LRSENSFLQLQQIDQTARKGFRLDYAGGVKGNAFFLKNCGFFFPSITIDSQFNIDKPTMAPVIDFEQLP